MVAYVFNFEKKKFVQVHAKKVDQLPATGVQGHQRDSEYMQFCLALEMDDEVQAERWPANKSD